MKLPESRKLVQERPENAVSSIKRAEVDFLNVFPQSRWRILDEKLFGGEEAVVVEMEVDLLEEVVDGL